MPRAVTAPPGAAAIRRLTGTLGAELGGIVLATADAAQVETLRLAVIAHRVVVLRAQFARPAELVALGRRLGRIMVTRGLAIDPDRPDIHVVTNPGKAQAITENWHTDATTSELPPSFTVLAAETLPDAGGDTLFVDMVDAYRALSPRLRHLLRDMRLHHVNRRFSTDRLIEAWHPLVRTIPETGERAIYGVFPGIAERIDGLTELESRAILDFLFAHATRPDRMYRHRWLPGDVVIWDNRSTLHYAVHDYGDAERTLLRLMIEGERPFEAPYPPDRVPDSNAASLRSRS